MRDRVEYTPDHKIYPGVKCIALVTSRRRGTYRHDCEVLKITTKDIHIIPRIQEDPEDVLQVYLDTLDKSYEFVLRKQSKRYSILRAKDPKTRDEVNRGILPEE